MSDPVILRRGGRRGALIGLGAAAMALIALEDMGRRGVSGIYLFILGLSVMLALFGLAQLRALRLDAEGFSSRSALLRRWGAVRFGEISGLRVDWFPPGSRQPPSLDLRIEHLNGAVNLSFYIEDEFKRFAEHLLAGLPPGLPGREALEAALRYRWSLTAPGKTRP